MTHMIGKIVETNIRIGPDTNTPSTFPGIWLLNFQVPENESNIPPRFVILHFAEMSFGSGGYLEINLGYAVDRFDAASGVSAWTRPIDSKFGPIQIRLFSPVPSGGVTLFEYGRGEPTQTGIPGAAEGSLTNPDLFLHTSPYVEPIYETRLKCGNFDWQNVETHLPDSIERRTSAAVGVMVVAHKHFEMRGLSSCSVTLVGPDIVLTAKHCMDDVDDLEVKSGSVTFDYQTSSSGGRAPGFSPRFFKIKRIWHRGEPGSDWVIAQLDTLQGFPLFPFRTLRRSLPVAGEFVTAIHHPNGAVKKIQTNPLVSANLSAVMGFDFAGGSSGSSLYDSSGRICGAALSSGVPGGNSCIVKYVSASTVLNELDTSSCESHSNSIRNANDAVLGIEEAIRKLQRELAGHTTPGDLIRNKNEIAREIRDLRLEKRQWEASRNAARNALKKCRIENGFPTPYPDV
jgi:Trypsin-like peptidase domain